MTRGTHSPTPPTPIFPLYLLPSLPFRRRRRPALGSSPPQSETPFSPTSTLSSPASLSSSPSSLSPSSPTDPASPEAFDAPYLHGHIVRLRCARCAADLALGSQIISKGFTGRHGRAYLVSASPSRAAATSGLKPSPPPSQSHHHQQQQQLPNTHTHTAVARQLVTGQHTVCDVSCVCGSVVGWKYEGAEEESQRYKVGKFILETKLIRADSCWEAGAWDELVPALSVTDVAAAAAAARRRSADGEGAMGERGAPERDQTVEFDSQDEDECEDLFAGVWSPALALKRRQGRSFGNVIKGMAAGAVLRGRLSSGAV